MKFLIKQCFPASLYVVIFPLNFKKIPRPLFEQILTLAALYCGKDDSINDNSLHINFETLDQTRNFSNAVEHQFAEYF